MQTKRRSRAMRWALGFAVWIMAMSATVALACSTPVFRYALERWPPDAYEAVVFHAGAMSADERAQVDRLIAAAADKNAPLNVVVREVDLSKAKHASLTAAAKMGESNRPWLALFFPSHGASTSAGATNKQESGEDAETLQKRLAWSGPIEKSAVDAIVDSPTRREVGKRLLSGDSVVWVFLESGNDSADEAAVTQLKQSLAQLEKELKAQAASAPAEAAEGDQAVDLSKVKIQFGLVRVKKGDAAERYFTHSLMNSEDGLEADKPTVFPIFGQGRALYAIAGRGINEANISSAVSFLTGSCSCEIKAQNPGVDVLMAVDWRLPDGQRVVPGGGEVDLTSLATLAEGEDAVNAGGPGSTAVTQPATQPAVSTAGAGANTSAMPPPPARSLSLSVLLLTVVGGVIALAIAAWLSRSRTAGGGQS